MSISAQDIGAIQRFLDEVVFARGKSCPLRSVKNPEERPLEASSYWLGGAAWAIATGRSDFADPQTKREFEEYLATAGNGATPAGAETTQTARPGSATHRQKSNGIPRPPGEDASAEDQEAIAAENAAAGSRTANGSEQAESTNKETRGTAGTESHSAAAGESAGTGESEAQAHAEAETNGEEKQDAEDDLADEQQNTEDRQADEQVRHQEEREEEDAAAGFAAGASKQFSFNDCSLLEAALAYVELGWSVFPLLPGEKKPKTKNGFKDASRDPRKIRIWWTKTPNANIGFATSQQSLRRRCRCERRRWWN
jgi:hypothetical protein